MYLSVISDVSSRWVAIHEASPAVSSLSQSVTWPQADLLNEKEAACGLRDSVALLIHRVDDKRRSVLWMTDAEAKLWRDSFMHAHLQVNHSRDGIYRTSIMKTCSHLHNTYLWI